MSNNIKNEINKMEIQTPKNVKITQPELKIAFLKKIEENKLGSCATRMIWDKMVRRKIFMEAINDLGDEYLNHKVYLYEDTLMQFELSQIANSYYYYDIFGYRLNSYNQGKSRGSTNGQTLAMNQLLFIKLLLYKVPTKFDRYHIFKEWGFAYCGSEVFGTRESDYNLLKEVLEAIFELEKLYHNTDKQLLECANKIKNHFNFN